jgi:hypothetical protein
MFDTMHTWLWHWCQLLELRNEMLYAKSVRVFSGKVMTLTVRIPDQCDNQDLVGFLE